MNFVYKYIYNARQTADKEIEDQLHVRIKKSIRIYYNI